MQEKMHQIFFIFGAMLNVSGSPQCPVPTTVQKSAGNEAAKYYWRDFNGDVPDDALPGGKDKSGRPTYIGQAYVKDFELLPATIYPGCNTAIVSAYNKQMNVDKNIKILCVENSEDYKWLKTKNEESHLLTTCQLVVGGSELGQNLNIGRVNFDGLVIIGKIFSNPLPNRGLWIPYNGREERFLSYEILTYNCDATD